MIMRRVILLVLQKAITGVSRKTNSQLWFKFSVWRRFHFQSRLKTSHISRGFITTALLSSRHLRKSDSQFCRNISFVCAALGCTIHTNEANKTGNLKSDEDDDGNMDRISNAGRLNKLTVAPPPGLPDRLVVLQAEDGSLVYLVGTWHFTKESIDDVVKTIQAVQPDKVVVELCTDALKLRFGKVQIFKQNEMKVAIAEAQKVPGTCEVCLGDLPLHIIRNHFRAAVEKLSTWDIFLFYLATRTIVEKLYSTKKSHVDRQKTWNALVEEQQIWRERFPGGYKVIMEERDVYLTHSLKMAAQALPHPKETGRMKPAVVVGVVGLGHLPGIVDNWNKELDPEAVTKTYLISDRLRNIKCVALLVKMTFIGMFVYVSYKVTHSLFGAKRLVVFLSLLGLGYYGTKEVLGQYWLSRKH